MQNLHTGYFYRGVLYGLAIECREFTITTQHFHDAFLTALQDVRDDMPAVAEKFGEIDPCMGWSLHAKDMLQSGIDDYVFARPSNSSKGVFLLSRSEAEASLMRFTDAAAFRILAKCLHARLLENISSVEQHSHI